MIDSTELKAAMKSFGFENKDPVIYAMVADLDTPENTSGINFEHLMKKCRTTSRGGYAFPEAR